MTLPTYEEILSEMTERMVVETGCPLDANLSAIVSHLARRQSELCRYAEELLASVPEFKVAP